MSGYGAPPTTPEAAAADAEIRNRLLTMAYGTKIGGATVKTESSD
jgi:hypothetical protein